MSRITYPRLGTVLLAVAAMTAAGAIAQGQSRNSNQSPNQAQSEKQQNQSRADQKPMVLQPDLPGVHRNHRLILKDGTYQMVTQYQIVGDRVRYFSAERDDWEEIPASLVDWPATRKWEAEHNPQAGGAESPAMKEAAALDAQETAERSDQRASMPEVARGLNLPNQDGVFVLDTYRGTPELVELKPTDVDPGARRRRGGGILNPLAGARTRLILNGEHAKVHLHVNEPSFYLSLDTAHNAALKEPVLANAMTIDTVSAKAINSRIYGAHSAHSQFAVVHLNERIAMRFLGPIAVSRTGQVIADFSVIPTTVEVMPGGRWLRVKPERPLLIGEYALVEILSPTEMNPSVWAFQVNPLKGDNMGALTPILGHSNQ